MNFESKKPKRLASGAEFEVVEAEPEAPLVDVFAQWLCVCLLEVDVEQQLVV
jgi:hypothetical protein